MITYYIALGSNMGQRQRHLEEALVEITGIPTVEMVAVSTIIETAPWGNTNQGPFLNGVCALRATLAPLAMLQALQAIEHKHGRMRKEHWGPRTLDLDILSAFSADGTPIEVQEESLTLPHPYMWERTFVLAPLAEIAPSYSYRGESIQDRLIALQQA